MDDELASGIERAVFGAIGRDNIDGWLSRHLRARLSVDLSQIVFRSGRIAAVYGAALSDGRQVAVKVHRQPTDLAYLEAATACQRRLAVAGYQCPEPLDGPGTTEGLTAVIETLLTDGEPGNGHEPSARRAMAHALFQQLALLSGAAVDGLLAGAPAWSHYEQGPWPKPHDPIFDFTITPEAFTWLDDLARRAASVLEQAGPPAAIAHADWTCGNVWFRDGQVSSSYDWDSLAAAPEAVLVGLAAGSFTMGSIAGANVPTPSEATAFLRDYEEVRSRPFSESEQRTAAAAVTWVLAYNARCAVSFLPPGALPPGGSALHALRTHRDAYLDLHW
jgi:Ser/Thr protein kinase RdoA (MazF antagonist)